MYNIFARSKTRHNFVPIAVNLISYIVCTLVEQTQMAENFRGLLWGHDGRTSFSFFAQKNQNSRD